MTDGLTVLRLSELEGEILGYADNACKMVSGGCDGNSIYYVISCNLKQNEASQIQLTQYSIDLQHQETEEYFFNNYIYTCWKASPVISAEDPNIRKLFSELSLTPASLFSLKRKFQDVV